MKMSILDKLGVKIILECDLVVAIGIGILTSSLICSTILLLVNKL